MIRFFDKAEPSGLGPDGLATYRLETYFECYRDFATRIVRRARPDTRLAVHDGWRAGGFGGPGRADPANKAANCINTTQSVQRAARPLRGDCRQIRLQVA